MIVVGVPLIVPVEESIVKPLGSVGATDHVTTAPPSELGVIGLIAESLVNVYGLPA